MLISMKSQNHLYTIPDAALATLEQAEETFLPASRKAIRTTTQFIRENPRTSIGIAALAAVALAFLFLPRNRD